MHFSFMLSRVERRAERGEKRSIPVARVKGARGREMMHLTRVEYATWSIEPAVRNGTGSLSAAC